MFDTSATVSLINESRDTEPTGVFSERLLVCLECSNYLLQRDTLSLLNKKQNLDTIVIRHSLQVSLHLLCRLYFRHRDIVYTTK